MKVMASEWFEFANDDVFWGAAKGGEMEDTLFLVESHEVSEIDPSLPPNTQIKVLEGVVVDEQYKVVASLPTYIKKWRTKKGVRQVVIQIPIEITDTRLRESIKETGGKIVN